MIKLEKVWPAGKGAKKRQAIKNKMPKVERQLLKQYDLNFKSYGWTTKEKTDVKTDGKFWRCPKQILNK
ncbi:hypothetical protein MSIBF_A1480012 [groundwater metagenome]|uniref:Uncharacterized protein n=1 Tax=groundwater metagenome TaxID=717931 RepID=A0A098E6E2_9ZZZZ